MRIASNSERALPFNWKNASILITGGTGSFGKTLVRVLINDFAPKKIIIFSRDELKQHEMRVSGYNHPCLRYFIGDVRDAARLQRAAREVDLIVHAAALKQVPACEYNPFEAILTNVIGARNIVDAAIDQKVPRVIALSTDKAVNPANLYGATKLCSEKLFVHGNSYSKQGQTRMSCVRYGNVVGSRGSVVPLFLEQRKAGRLTITDERMTRFWITLEQGVRFVINCVEKMSGEEVFVPKIPSMRVTDLAEAIAPNCKREFVGIRAGEKLHEVLVSEDEARNTFELDNLFVIYPAEYFAVAGRLNGKLVADGFRYASNTNTQWLTSGELMDLASNIEPTSQSSAVNG